jgi:molecular chaperone DnaK
METAAGAGRIVGIDLGTTNSLVAVIEGGRPRVLPVDGRPLLPSVVGLDAEGRRIVGEAARNQYATAPERTVRSIKRQMGKPGATVRLGAATHTPEEVSSFILERLREAAALQLGESPGRAVITVPAYFTDRQRQATVRAGELAGLEVVRLLNEPTAAALAYGLDRSGASLALVYDLGGGTFDVSVVEMGGGITEVRASHGDRELGGDDFDARIVDWLAARFQEEHGVDLRQDPVAMARLQRAAEAAKIRLSDHAYAEIREEFLATRGRRGLHLHAELQRAEFERMIRPLLDGTVAAVRRALQDSRLDARALDEVLLVGGSTHIPAVWNLVAEELGCAPRQDISPEEVVALGAAVQAGVIAGDGVEAILVDVAAHSLGIRALRFDADGEPDVDHFAPLIRRNTAIPVSRSEFFYTVTPDQDEVDVEVYQGEEAVASRNTLLGRVQFRNLSPSPDGRQREILVAFDYDLSGILHVSVVDRRSGHKEEVRLDTVGLGEVPAGGLSAEDADLLGRLRTLAERWRAEGGAEKAEVAELDGLIAAGEGTGDGFDAAAWREDAASFLFEHEWEEAEEDAAAGSEEP